MILLLRRTDSIFRLGPFTGRVTLLAPGNTVAKEMVGGPFVKCVNLKPACYLLKVAFLLACVAGAKTEGEGEGEGRGEKRARRTVARLSPLPFPSPCNACHAGCIPVKCLVFRRF